MQGTVPFDLAGNLTAALHDPILLEAASALQANQLAIAEHLLRVRLREKPIDVAAIRMLAEVAGRLGRYADAEKLLRRALDLAPDFHAARSNFVTVLQRQSKFDEAHRHADHLLATNPHDPAYLSVKAGVLVRTGGYDDALAAYREILDRFPDQPRLWISYGHVLKTVGLQSESISAYRRAIAIEPTLGDAWWSLANLKTVRLDLGDIQAMRAALSHAKNDADRYHLHFALGKALEDAGEFGESFAHYASGNQQRRAELPYDADQTTLHLDRTRRLLTRVAFESRAGYGNPAADPIFVVGLPRAGSTLIEQILASHSQVEGTMELPDITTISADLSGRHSRGESDTAAEGYIARLLELGNLDLIALGRRYLDGTRVQRKTARALFIDKMPNNFAHTGLIHLILPNAKIIDARRHPLANCFSAFKQHFSRGQGFTYDFQDLGRYYQDYVALMNHYDTVLPGRVHRVFYEQLVADPEGQILALLAHCGLAFEPACLAFHANQRAVRTASSEQVRRPINADAVEHWRNYEPWIGPLKEALGNALDEYPCLGDRTAQCH